MTVIDIHSHLWAEDWMPAAWWETQAEIITRELEKRGRPKDFETVREEFVPSFWDPEAEGLRSGIEKAGLDRRVVFPVDWGLALGEPSVGIREYNRVIADLADEDDRVVAFATIDPRRDGAAEFIDEALSDWGMRGLKLHPTAGFDPRSEETYELLEVARDHGVPVLTHTGPISAALYSEYAHPNRLDRVLTDFPDLPIIAAHMGLGWWRDFVAIAEMNVNAELYTDICAWQDRVETERGFEEFSRAVRACIDALGADRVLFGTDSPVFEMSHPTDEWIGTVESLADRETEPTFTDREIDRILGENAVGLLG